MVFERKGNLNVDFTGLVLFPLRHEKVHSPGCGGMWALTTSEKPEKNGRIHSLEFCSRVSVREDMMSGTSDA